MSYGEQAVASGLPLPTSQGRLDSTPPAWLADADLVALGAQGEALYQKHQCRSCHEDGENPKDLYRLDQRLGYNAVIETLRAPQSPMPVYPLSAQEQQALAVYLLNRPDPE